MCALRIVELRNKNILHLNVKEFAEITTRYDLANRSLAVISIAGAMRKGKSFLLNFFLTYAYDKYPSTKTIAQPKTFENGSIIDGFSHSGGSERHTTGILVWPDIFLHDYPDGRKIAILFMDTQGTFDYDTNFSDTVLIFALSTLLSSVQIYNINNNIQNDHLQYLALFVEYAKIVLNKIIPIDDNIPPLNTLQILVRDWNFPQDANYGLTGGKKRLDTTFSSTNTETRKTVSSIKHSFKSIECYLMPFPGELIANAPKFDGNIEKIDASFREHVDILTDHFLNPNNLKTKTINGTELKVGDFVNLIEQGFELLRNHDNIPKPKTIVAATAESQNFKLIADAVDLYRKSMSNHLASKHYLDNSELIQLHKKYLDEAMLFYDNIDKLETFDEETDAKWKTHLNDLLTHEYNFLLILNEKYKPNTSQILQKLIDVVAEQKDIIQQLNEQHAQNMLDLINTFRQHEEEYKEHITELTQRFEQSPSSGIDFMKIIVKFIPVIPSTIIALGLHQTPLGKAVLGGCAIAKIILKHFDI